MKDPKFCLRAKPYFPGCCCSVTELCMTLCNPVDCSTSGFPVLHHLLEHAQTHVHWVGDVVQLSYLLSPPSPLALNLSQHQNLFPEPESDSESALHIRWPEYWSFSFSISPSNKYSGLISLGLTGLISLQSKGLSRVFSNTTIQKHQFFGTQPSLWSNSHIHTWLLEKPIALMIPTFIGNVMSLLFNTLSRFVIAFLPRSKHFLFHGCSHHLEWFWSPRN